MQVNIPQQVTTRVRVKLISPDQLVERRIVGIRNLLAKRSPGSRPHLGWLQTLAHLG